MKTIIAILLSVITFTTHAKTFEIYFLDDTCIVPGKKYKYHTCHEMRIVIDDNWIIIPKDFETDIASIPRPLWSIIPPVRADIMQAAILHDHLYRHPCFYNRKDADLIFYQILRENGVYYITANAMYFGVRLFGGSSFKKDNC